MVHLAWRETPKTCRRAIELVAVLDYATKRCVMKRGPAVVQMSPFETVHIISISVELLQTESSMRGN